jgi:hypothetical protein
LAFKRRKWKSKITVGWLARAKNNSIEAKKDHRFYTNIFVIPQIYVKYFIISNFLAGFEPNI